MYYGFCICSRHFVFCIQTLYELYKCAGGGVVLCILYSWSVFRCLYSDRLILCTLYGPVECPEEGLLGGGMFLVHSDIYYVPVVDDCTQVLVHNVIHYVPVLDPSHHLQVHNTVQYSI